MTTHKNQVGQAGTGINGGEFARKTHTDADDVVNIPEDSLEQAYTDLAARVDGVEGELTDAAAAAISALVRDKFPSATSVSLVDVSDEGERYLVVNTIREGDKDPLWDATIHGHSDLDESFIDKLNDYAPTLGRDVAKLHRTKKGGGYILSLSGDAGEEAFRAADAKFDDAQLLADNGLKQVAALTRRIVESRVKEEYPEAAAVFLININDEDGYPFLNLSTVEDAAGNTIYDAENDGDEEFNEYVNEYAVAADRDLDALENIDDEGWSFEGLWKLTF